MVQELKLRVISNIKSLPDVFKEENKTPSIKELDILLGSEVTIAHLNLAISDFYSFYSVGKGMNDPKILYTSMLIFNKYPTLKIGELYFLFSEIQAGKYGKSYDRMDGAIIMKCLQEYFDKRFEEAERISLQEHDCKKERTGDSFSVQQAKSEHQKLVENLAKKYENK